MSASTLPHEKRRILFLCAHPDDVEAHAGGSVARWTAEGWSVRFVFFTSGDKGSDDPAADPAALMAQRETEQHIPVQAIAWQYAFRQRLVDCNLTGARTVDQLKQNLEAAVFPISEAVWQEFEDMKLTELF